MLGLGYHDAAVVDAAIACRDDQHGQDHVVIDGIGRERLPCLAAERIKSAVGAERRAERSLRRLDPALIVPVEPLACAAFQRQLIGPADNAHGPIRQMRGGFQKRVLGQSRGRVAQRNNAGMILGYLTV